jgi:hypothetical protein
VCFIFVAQKTSPNRTIQVSMNEILLDGAQIKKDRLYEMVCPCNSRTRIVSDGLT